MASPTGYGDTAHRVAAQALQFQCSASPFHTIDRHIVRYAQKGMFLQIFQRTGEAHLLRIGRFPNTTYPATGQVAAHPCLSYQRLVGLETDTVHLNTPGITLRVIAIHRIHLLILDQAQLRLERTDALKRHRASLRHVTGQAIRHRGHHVHHASPAKPRPRIGNPLRKVLHIDVPLYLHPIEHPFLTRTI